MERLIEISDVIIDFDEETLERKPVEKKLALERLKLMGRRAQRIVERIPEKDGVLDENYVDNLLFCSHCEMQRLWEELLSGKHVANILQVFVEAMRQANIEPPYRIVDIGCGLGYNLRLLASQRIFAEDVELIGVDYNKSLITTAQKLADMEELNCKFFVANAFKLKEQTSVFMSTGVIHHFSPQHLPNFFAGQQGCYGFFHFDIQPHMLAPIGAWIFHQARMRIALARHDGFVSALRGHSIDCLAECAKQGLSSYHLVHHGCKIPFFPIIRNMHAIIGIHPNLTDNFLKELPNPRKLWRKLT